MENNIFVKIKKDKFNPDIEPKLKTKETERTNTSFNMSNNIYNPITGVVPQKVTTTNDLFLEKDGSISRKDINKLIQDKAAERNNQDNEYKPVKTKIINNNPLIASDSTPSNTHTTYVSTFEDMKKSSNISRHVEKTKSYDNIMIGLKELGILQ